MDKQVFHYLLFLTVGFLMGWKLKKDRLKTEDKLKKIERYKQDVEMAEIMIKRKFDELENVNHGKNI